MRRIAAALWAAGMLAAQTPLAIVGGQVVDGSGAAPIPDGVVIVSGGRIQAVGSEKAVTVPAGARIVHAGGMTVMPGLIDMHVHLGLIGHTDEEHFVRQHLARMEKEIIPAGARQYLMNGVTTVRDVGSPMDIVKVRDRIARGELAGARLFVSGLMLQRRMRDILLGWSQRVDGVEDARAKVRALAAAGVDWIKVHDPPNFSDEELKAVMEEAAKAGKPVAGHGYASDAEMLRAVRFRFKTLEHPGLGNLYRYSPEATQRVIDSDSCIVPTSARRTIFEETERFPARLNDFVASQTLPADLYRSLRDSLADHLHLPNADRERRWAKNLRAKVEPFVKAGACIVAGTDSGEPELIHGSSTWYELKNFVGFGMTPLEAITAATSRPGNLLAPDIGQLRPGFRADVILVKGDVTRNIGLLANVAHVIKDGVVYK